jgi:hypothetical protein
VFASWVVFVVAGLAFQRMTEGAPFNAAGAAQPAVGWSYAAIVAGALASLAAVAVAGAPIAIAIARVAARRRRWRQLALLAVPAFALAIWIGLTAVLLALGDPPADGPWRVAAFLAWVGVFVLAAIASTVAVSAAALDAEIDDSFYRRAARPAVATAAAMAAVVVAVLGWGFALAMASPTDFWGSAGYFGTSTALNWLAIAIVMAGATAIAIRFARAAQRAVPG